MLAPPVPLESWRWGDKRRSKVVSEFARIGSRTGSGIAASALRMQCLSGDKKFWTLCSWSLKLRAHQLVILKVGSETVVPLPKRCHTIRYALYPHFPFYFLFDLDVGRARKTPPREKVLSRKGILITGISEQTNDFWFVSRRIRN